MARADLFLRRTSWDSTWKLIRKLLDRVLKPRDAAVADSATASASAQSL